MKMNRAGLTGLLVCAATSSVNAPSAAALPSTAETVAQQLVGSPASDGKRWVAFMSSPSVVQVIDEQAGTRFESTLPIPCAQPGGLMAVGGGQALFDCGGGDWYWYGRPLMLDLTTREWHEPPGLADALRHRGGSEMGAASLYRVGSYWLAGSAAEYRSYETLFVNWRTGQFATEPGDGYQPQLDDEQLDQPLCDPLLREPAEPDSAGDGPAFHPYEYEPPYALESAPLTLRRCGSFAGVSLSAKSGRAPHGQLGSGYVTWLDSGQAHAYVPACGARFSWSMAGAAFIAHTSGAVFVGRPDRVPSLVRIPLPRCPRLTQPGAVMIRQGSTRRAALPFAASWPGQRESTPRLAFLAPPRPSGRGVRLMPGRMVTVEIGVRAARVRWQAGDAPTRRAARHGAGWRFRMPPRRSGRRALIVGIRTPTGALARYQLPLR